MTLLPSILLLLIGTYLFLISIDISHCFNVSTVDLQSILKNRGLPDSARIIAAENYTSLFVWNELRITQLEELFDFEKEVKFFTFDNSLTSELMKQTLEFIGKDVKRNSFYSIPKLWKFKQIQMNRNTECIYGSVFEVFDVMIGTPFEFSERIRMNRNHRQFKKKSSDYLNPSDFHSIPLFPSTFWILSGSNYRDDEIVKKLEETIHNKSEIHNITACSESIKHDSRVLERLHGVLNFTSTQLEWSFKFINFSSSPFAIPHNTTFLQRAIEFTKQKDDLFWNQSKVEDNLWPSSCFPCSSSSCVSERWAWPDTLDLTMTTLGVFYYILLFASGSFKSPVIYRKYPIVFFGPLIIMGIYTSMINAFNNSCISVGVIFTVYLAALLNVMYVCTVLRYYYLRNLYNFVKDSKHPKLYKFLAGEIVGFFFTLILPIPLAFIAAIPIFSLVTMYNSLIVNTTNNVIIILFCAVSCVAGVIFLIYEAVRNRKIIAKFGIGRFLIFEDPYYFRVDLLSLAVIFSLLVVLTIVFFLIPSSIAAIRFVIGLALYMQTGGTSIMMLLIENVRSGNANKHFGSSKKIGTTTTSAAAIDDEQMGTAHSNSEYIGMIKNNSNKDLVDLFKIYCEKSLALENVMLMDLMVELKRKSDNIKVEDLKKMRQMFLTPYSAYEVNVSSVVRNGFEKDLQEAESAQSQKINNQVLDSIMMEVEMNMVSTFSRFSRTSEFRQWKEVYQLQKSQLVTVL